MFGPKWSQHIDKTRMLHDSIFISWISSSVAPTRTAPPEHSLFQGSFYFLHVETDVSLGAEPHAPRRQEKTVATTWVGADAGSGDARGSLVAGDDDDKRRLDPRPHAPSSTTDADTRTAT